MCGRVTVLWTWAELFEMISLVPSDDLPDFEPRYNLAPTAKLWLLRSDEDSQLRPERARWGMIPSWWRHGEKLPSTHNAKAERLEESGMLRKPYRKQRCIIPISGFFEWKMMPERSDLDLFGVPVSKKPKMVKRPFYITRNDGKPILLAAIWDIGPDPDTGEPTLSAANITCEPDEWMSGYHHRMPVILEEEEVARWIETGDEELLRTPDKNVLQAWPVKRDVGSPAYQSPDAIKPWDDH